MISDAEHVFFTAERKPPLNLYPLYIYTYIIYMYIIYVYIYICTRVLNVADKKRNAEIPNKICFIFRMVFCL